MKNAKEEYYFKALVKDTCYGGWFVSKNFFKSKEEAKECYKEQTIYWPVETGICVIPDEIVK